MYVCSWIFTELCRLFLPKHRVSGGVSGGKDAVQYYTSWDEISVKTWEHEAYLEEYGSLVFRYVVLGIKTRFKQEERMQNAEGIEYNLLNACSPVQKARHMLLPAVKYVVILEGDREYMIVTLLDGTYISKLSPQVGNWQAL